MNRAPFKLVVMLFSGCAAASWTPCVWSVEQEEAWMQIFDSHAEDYEFYPKGLPDQKFTRIKEPAFRHDAPSRNSDDIGGVWVWVDRYERPAVVGTIFGWTIGENQRAVLHELHALYRLPIEGHWRDANHWRPEQALAYAVAPDAPVPDSDGRRRDLQLRRIARRFSAYTIDNRGKRWQLRLVPAPIYRWDNAHDSESLGGAVFVICQDTNTDVVLCIEAVQSEHGPRFAYACASYADWEAHVELDDNEVWTSPNQAEEPRNNANLHWVRMVPAERIDSDR